VIEKYLYAQTFLSLLTAAVNGTIYGYLHVPASFLFALTTFWLNFIPVVGSVIAVILPMPLALLVLDMQDCAVAFVLPCIVQLVIGNTLYPILMGRTMLLHPVTILVGMSM
jgi:AI-2 transport protein TqsA